MTVQQKRRLFSAVLLLGILAAAIGLILPFQRTSEAFDPNEPPVIDLAGLDVLPPISGATPPVSG